MANRRTTIEIPESKLHKQEQEKGRNVPDIKSKLGICK